MATTIPAHDVTKLVKAVMILAAAVLISLVAAFLAIYSATNSKTISIAVDHRGVVIPVIPLSDPLIAESRVVGFVEECLRKAFSHDFLHYSDTIPIAQDCFKPESADAYAVSLQPYVELMKQKRMVMAVTIPRPPRVVSVFKLGGVVNWEIQAQIDIFFEGRNERIAPTRSTVKLTVLRVPVEGTPRGILIDKFSVGTGV